jgi:hypothetical protein
MQIGMKTVQFAKLMASWGVLSTIIDQRGLNWLGLVVSPRDCEPTLFLVQFKDHYSHLVSVHQIVMANLPLVDLKNTTVSSVRPFDIHLLGPINTGWNVTYTGNDSAYALQTLGRGETSHRISLLGAYVELDWTGTAASGKLDLSLCVFARLFFKIKTSQRRDLLSPRRNVLIKSIRQKRR